MAPRLRSTRIVSPLLLLALGAFAAAAADEPKDARKPGARVTVNKERVNCATERVPCEDGSKTHVVVEQDVSVTLEIKQKPTTACAATVDFEYQQRNTTAVDTALSQFPHEARLTDTGLTRQQQRRPGTSGPRVECR